MSSHDVITTDEEVRGRPGTVARCSCGWVSHWGIRDGSAESDAHHHLMIHDSEYEQKHRARVGIELAPSPPTAQPIRCHGCSCHISAPCGSCENCKHYDDPECGNDCQECEEGHD